ncbi:MAG: hypothetical protein ACE5H3_09450, partial [Planctomycetota bacterium]
MGYPVFRALVRASDGQRVEESVTDSQGRFLLEWPWREWESFSSSGPAGISANPGRNQVRRENRFRPCPWPAAGEAGMRPRGSASTSRRPR